MKDALGTAGWVITGSCHGWGHEVIDHATLLVFVTLDTPTRLKRLVLRQTDRFGDRIKQGGDMADIHSEFIEWASKYDDPYFAGRNREQHERWFGSQNCAKCQIDGGQPVPASITQVMAHLV